MSFAAVIVGGAAVAGSVISSKSASKSAKSASNSEAAQLDFAQQQYDDWQAVYGPIQDNLAGYYGSLTPEHFEAVGLEAVEGEFEVLRNDIAQSTAQRGLTDSGLATAVETDIGIQEAEARADVRRAAPSMAAEEQSRFLQIGLGSDPSSSVSQALSQQASGARSRANAAAQSSASATQAAITTVGTGLSDYFANRETGGA